MASKKLETSKNAKAKTAKKKRKINILSGVAHIHSSANNTIVAISDDLGNIVSWASSGSVGYKGSKKSTPYSAGQAASEALKKAMALGLKTIKINVNGVGQGKDTALRTITESGLEVTELCDVTPIPHNGCKPPKKPR